MTDIIKITSNISVFDQEQSSQLKKLFDQILLLQPSTYYNGKKTLQVDSGNSFIGQDVNSFTIFSTNGYPFSLTITSSGGDSIELVELYSYSYCSSNTISFEAYNLDSENESEVVFFIGETEVLSNSYVYS